jgi:hypothetical protein
MVSATPSPTHIWEVTEVGSDGKKALDQQSVIDAIARWEKGTGMKWDCPMVWSFINPEIVQDTGGLVMAYTDLYTREVQLDVQAWIASEDVERDIILAHESGHCIHRWKHSGNKAHIMWPLLPSKYEWWEREDTYYRQLSQAQWMR